MPDEPKEEIVLSPKLESLAEEYAEDPTSKKFLPLAEEYRKSKLFDEAIYICQEGLKHHPDFLPATITLARSYLESEDKDNALSVMLPVEEENPENVPVLRLMGDIYHAMDELEKAEDYYNRVLRINPEDEVVAKKLHSLGKAPEETIEFEQPSIDMSSTETPLTMPKKDFAEPEDEQTVEEDIDLDLTESAEFEEMELSLPEQEEDTGAIELSYVPPLDSNRVEFVQSSEKQDATEEAGELMIEVEETDDELDSDETGGEIELEPSGTFELDTDRDTPREVEQPMDEGETEDSVVSFEIESEDTIGSLSKEQIDIDMYDQKAEDGSNVDLSGTEKQESPEFVLEAVDLDDMREDELSALDSSELKLEIDSIVSDGKSPAEATDTGDTVKSEEAESAVTDLETDVVFDQEDVFAPSEDSDSSILSTGDDKSFLLDTDEETVVSFETPHEEEVAEKTPEEDDQAEVAKVVPFTATSAKILEEQGHTEKALEIYKKLETENPADTAIRDKVRELENSLLGAESLSQNQKIEILERWLKNIEEYKNSMERR